MSQVCFYDKENLQVLQFLEDNYLIIRAELESLLNCRFSIDLNSVLWKAAHPSYVKNESGEISWSVYNFVFFGIWFQENCEMYPKTYELIQQIPELITAQFSILKPHTQIKPHKGYSTIILRNHLPLLVPAGDLCGIRVGDETRYWKEGELLTFDDSIEHEAWNNSDELRAVLMFDIAKPGCGYTADEIAKYKIETLSDPYLLNIAPKETWKTWYDKFSK